MRISLGVDNNRIRNDIAVLSPRTPDFKAFLAFSIRVLRFIQ
jgi:hypothetical protein